MSREVRRRAAVTIVALLPLAAACGSAPDRGGPGPASAEAAREAAPAASDSVRSAAVKAAARRFKDALARGDSAAALALLHPEAVVHEGGHAETRSEYRAGHLGADMEFLGSVETETTREEVVPGAEHALYLSEYRMRGRLDGDSLRLSGVETMVLVPASGVPASGAGADSARGGSDGGGWLIRHIHWSSREADGG